MADQIEESDDSKAITGKLPLVMDATKSDRVMLEDHIDKVAARSDYRIEAVERRQISQTRWLIAMGVVVLITLGMASASFGVQMYRMSLLAEKGELK